MKEQLVDKITTAISISTWVYYWEPLKEVLEKIANAGYLNVEIWADKAHLDPIIAPDILMIKNLFRNLSLQVHSLHAPFSGVNIAALDEEYRKCSLSLIKKSIEFCSELEGKIVVVHPHINGVFFNPEDEMKIIGRIKESLNEIAIFAKKMGVKIAVENVPKLEGWSFGSNVSKLWKLIEEINNDNLGLCLDTGHFFVKGANSNLSASILHCSKYLTALHIQDTDGKRDRHWLPGEGIIDWPKFFKTLKTVNYQGMLTLEITGSKQIAAHNVNNVLIKAMESVKRYFIDA